jgi:2-keto-3-deoxy-L-rhamnonate aldolase RhmA
MWLLTRHQEEQRMHENFVKHKLDKGGVALGTMAFEFASAGIARIAAHAGAEFIIYDMEHSGWSFETIRMLVACTRGTSAVPMVRVPDAEYHLIARALDVGAMGLMIPNVETEEEARFIVQSAKYTPQGQQGWGATPAHPAYGAPAVSTAMQETNQELLLMAQIESGQGAENASRIAAVEGIDVLWIGQFDLSNALGIPAQFEHPLFRRAVDQVLAACQKRGKTAAMMATGAEDALSLLQQGFRCLAYSTDHQVYARALRQGLEAVKAGMATQARP